MSEDTKNIKVALIGDSGVGKSSIALRYTTNEFDVNYMSTNGAAYSNKIVKRDDETLQLDIWDTAGQERFRSLGRNFYKDAFIVILVYDITRPESFKSLKEIWYEELKQHGEDKPVIAIVGNKSDQYENENIVNEEEARKYAESVGGIFQQVSAKTGSGINDLFNECIDKYYELKFPEKVQHIADRRKSTMLFRDDPNNVDNMIKTNGKKKKCC